MIHVQKKSEHLVSFAVTSLFLWVILSFAWTILWLNFPWHKSSKYKLKDR